MADLKGKVALITGMYSTNAQMEFIDFAVHNLPGSSAGIGAATAQLFASHGCHVSLVGRNEQRLKQVADKCSAANKDVKVI